MWGGWGVWEVWGDGEMGELLVVLQGGACHDFPPVCIGWDPRPEIETGKMPIPPTGSNSNCSLFPVPYSLFPVPYSLFPTPYSLLPTPT
ncbi:MAG: hypothetical protein F6K56_19885 [Moorea sp. SIO3G5]|nr:hypothetical protein [Moorena sp. SIO3G5]